MSIPNVQSVNVVIPYGAGTITAGTSNYLAFAMPGTLYGGGVTLLGVKYASNKAIGAGTAPYFRIVTMTSTGGTIGTIAAAGSTALSAGTPIDGTISSAWIPGTVSYVAVQVGHEAAGGTDVALSAMIQYYVGRGSA